MTGSRLVIAKRMRSRVLENCDQGQPGILKAKTIASNLVLVLYLNAQIKEYC